MEIKTNNYLNSHYWPFIMLFAGILMVIYQSVGFAFLYVPGDLGDGRFNNYILEHGYRYLTGVENSFWSASFMFPEKETVSYSDNLLGALPLYAFFRIWFDRETAIQCWYLLLIILNFLGGFYALKKLKFTNYSSSMGAFIYAFSLILLLQTGHIQLLARFAAPFSIVYFYLWLRDNKINYFYIAIVCLIIQFYCAIYLGYFLLYALLLIISAYMILEMKWDRILNLISKKNWLKTLLFTTFTCLFLGLLFYPYYLRSINTPYPPSEEMRSMIPRIWSYFYCTKNSILWGGITSWLQQEALPKGLPYHEHAIFIGFMPYLFLILTVLLYRKKSFAKFIIIVILLYIILTTSVFDFSIYNYIVKLIPGAQALRAFSRIMVIFMFFWCIISSFFLDAFFEKLTPIKTVVLFLIPMFLIVDNIQKANSYVCRKLECQERCQTIVNKFQKNKMGNEIAFSYQFKPIDFPDLIHKQIDAMMASQVLNVPCVNAYTARIPDEYTPYFYGPDSITFNAWMNSNYLKNTKNNTNTKLILIVK